MSADKTSDIGPRTLATINVISAWVVNTFYNFLHQQAVNLHTHGRVANITDGYKFIVRQYLDSFNNSDGYKRNLLGLHRYYMDNTRHSSIPFDVWIRDILSHFVPIDYFTIMSNIQQDSTLRSILLNSIIQFSRDVICTSTLDMLIANHSHPSLVPIMKKSMSSALLFERQKLFQALFKSSTGGSQEKPMDMMRNELTKLVEENVMLKHKNKKAIASLKNAVSKMKDRDIIIRKLNDKIKNLDNAITATKRSYEPPAPPPSPTATFINAVEQQTGMSVQKIIAQEQLPEQKHEDEPDHNFTDDHGENYSDNYVTLSDASAEPTEPIQNESMKVKQGDADVVSLNLVEFLESYE